MEAVPVLEVDLPKDIEKEIWAVAEETKKQLEEEGITPDQLFEMARADTEKKRFVPLDEFIDSLL